jgi:hypothetical protein
MYAIRPQDTFSKSTNRSCAEKNIKKYTSDLKQATFVGEVCATGDVLL